MMISSRDANSVRRAVDLALAYKFLLICLLTAGRAAAQETDPTPLVVPFHSVPPFMQIDRNGARDGFFAALAQAISREIDVPIEFLDVPAAGGVVESQVSGRSHMVAGIVRLAPMVDNTVYSRPVAEDVLRFAVLADKAASLESGPVLGKRIGIVPPTLGSEEAVLAQNTPVSFVNVEAALIGLLKGEVEALLIPPPTVFRLAREAGVDGRIVFAGRPVRELQRFVALHKSRADLLPAINAAIDRLEASGELSAIRERYSIDVPPPEPEVLRVPLPHAPPYGILSEDGTVSGYAADLLRGLANRAGLRIELLPVSLEAYREAISTRVFDVIPFVLAADDLGSDLDLTIPIDTSDVEILVNPDDDRFASWKDLLTARVGATPGMARVARQSRFPAEALRVYPSIADLEAALSEGEIDALMAIGHTLRIRGITSRFRSIGSPDFTAANTIGLRPGLGAVRERLNAVIPGYLLSAEYAQLRQHYFAKEDVWTQTRSLYALAAALCAMMILALIRIRDWRRLRQRAFEQQAMDLAREQEHARELQIIVKQLEQANREQAEFTYAVSHDLKSPANTIGMLIDVLSEEATLDADARSLLADMARTNAHMRQLVESVLAYSRVVDEEMGIEPVDMEDLMRDIQVDLRGAIVAAEAVLEVAPLPVIRGSKVQLRMLFQNLLSNAVKFRRPDRKPLVRVDVVPQPDALTVIVADNGIGIPEKYRERVFGLFQRLHNQSAYEGTGLGLSICKRVMSNHRGDIRIATGIDGGTAFLMTFREGGR